MHKEASEKASSELNKLKMMSPMSAEATVVRNYVDWLVSVPWKKRSKISRDINKAEKILEEDHYGLDKVKERILEYLAVQQRVKTISAAAQNAAARGGIEMPGIGTVIITTSCTMIAIASHARSWRTSRAPATLDIR